jgi:hypothetical protein
VEGDGKVYFDNFWEEKMWRKNILRVAMNALLTGWAQGTKFSFLEKLFERS